MPGKKIEMLSMGDPDFGEKLMDAIGAKPGDTVRVVSSPHERPKNFPQPKAPPEPFESVRSMTVEELIARGCGRWDTTDKGIHVLFPKEWYDSIPEGFELVCISGEKVKFKKGSTDDDIRFGCLAYGIVVPLSS